jgi:hypothetical protein
MIYMILYDGSPSVCRYGACPVSIMPFSCADGARPVPTTLYGIVIHRPYGRIIIRPYKMPYVIAKTHSVIANGVTPEGSTEGNQSSIFGIISGLLRFTRNDGTAPFPP